MSPISTCRRRIEAYYQETGRAGRDGLPAEAWMGYGMADVVQRRRMIDEGNGPDEIKRVSSGKLNALLAVCETAGCRRQAILAHFGEAHPGAVRQLRHLPHAGRDLGRHRGRASRRWPRSTAPASASAPGI